MDDLIALLAQAAKLAKVHHVEAVVIAGDLFHHKAGSRTSHRLVQAIIRLFQSFPCPVYVVPGNHDITNDRLESIHDTQPLGVLFESGAALELSGWDGDLYGVPWQQRWTDESVSAVLEGYREWEVDGCPKLVVAHAPLYPPGLELPFENFPAGKWAEAMGGSGQCFYGHVHESHGIWQAGGVTFANFGALSRGSLHEHNLSRRPAVTLWDERTGEFTPIVLQAKPASEVFRLQEKAEATDMAGRLDEFLSAIGATDINVVSVESVMAYVAEQQLCRQEYELIHELLMGAQK